MKYKAILIITTLSFACITSTFADCTFQESSFPEAAKACLSGRYNACEDGTWIDIGAACGDAANEQSKTEPASCICTNEEEASCRATEKKCGSTLEMGRCVSRCVVE